MPAAKSSKDLSLLEMVRDRIQSLDPMQSTVMLLGGTASSCGIVPPMTQLLASMNGKDGGGVNLQWFTPGIGFYKAVVDTIGHLFGGSEAPAPQTSVEDYVKVLGLFCSGAVEASIMYALVNNPETFKALIKMPGQAIEGLGKMIPV